MTGHGMVKFMSTWLGHRVPRHLLTHSAVSLKVSLGEINIWINWSLPNVSGPYSISWSPEKKKRLTLVSKREPLLPDCLQAAFTCLWFLTETLALPGFGAFTSFWTRITSLVILVLKPFGLGLNCLSSLQTADLGTQLSN